MPAEAFYSEEHRCWFVPVASELLEGPQDNLTVAPARIEFRDRQLWITLLATKDALLSLEFERAVAAGDLVGARRIVNETFNLRVGS